MQKFDLHMHTTYCDGKDSAEAMVISAIENGLSCVGISGHSYTPHDSTYCMSREVTLRYIDEINMLKKKYAGQIRLLLGIELDRYADTDTTPYDYIIGSAHYMFTEEGERRRIADPDSLEQFRDWGAVDDSAEDLVRFAARDCSEEEAGPDVRREKLLDAAEIYFNTVGGIIEATDCDIVGHFDLITKFTEGWGFGPAGNVIRRCGCGADEFISPLIDTSDERYIAAWKQAIDRISDACAARYANGYRNRLETLGLLEAGDKPVFEINTGAISKGYRTVPYPSAEQIAYIRSKGGVLILDSDSHAAGTICYGFEEFSELL